LSRNKQSVEAKCTRRNEQNGGEQQNSLGWNERNGKQGDFGDREEWLKAIRLFSTSEKMWPEAEGAFFMEKKGGKWGNVPPMFRGNGTSGLIK
jgi:hypothetical protein